jgi:hypothetical protein
LGVVRVLNKKKTPIGKAAPKILGLRVLGVVRVFE